MSLRRAAKMTARWGAARAAAARGHTAPRHAARPGYTLVELFLVVAILAVVVSVSIPAFTAMQTSANRALASNSLVVSLRVAKAIAEAGEADTCVAFLQDEGGNTRAVPCVYVGTLEDKFSFGGDNTAQRGPLRDVFAPLDDAPNIAMPAGWQVAGLAPAGLLSQTDPRVEAALGNSNVCDWYNTLNYGGRNPSDPAKEAVQWLLPQSGYYDVGLQYVQGAASTPTPRQSFMVRFEARTGSAVTSGRDALVIDVRPNEARRNQALSGVFAADRARFRADQADSLIDWARTMLAERAVSREIRSRILGNASNDTVLCRAVTQLAVFRTQDLLTGIGARRANATTGTVYRAWSENRRVEFDFSIFAGNPARDDNAEVRGAITQWIGGDTNLNGQFVPDLENPPAGVTLTDEDRSRPDQPRAILFAVQVATGEIVETIR